MAKWLRLHASNAGGAGSIPGWGSKIPLTAQSGQTIKKSPEPRLGLMPLRRLKGVNEKEGGENE